jgi:hypothetical protein
MLTASVHRIMSSYFSFIVNRRQVFFPSSFVALRRLLIRFDRTCNRYLRDSLDYTISACVILAIGVLILVVSLFLLRQVGIVSDLYCPITDNSTCSSIVALIIQDSS